MASVDQTPSQTLSRRYGPEQSPVEVACGCDDIRRALDRIEASVASADGFVLVLGDHGTGKTVLFEAAIAQCENLSVSVQILWPEDTEPQSLLKSIQGDEPVVTFELPDSLSAELRSKLLKEVHRSRKCAIVFALALSAAEKLTLQSDGWDVCRLPTPQDSALHALAVAEVMWLQDSRSDETLRAAFAEDAVDGLVIGPWLNGFHSMRAFFAKLCDTLVLQGNLADGELRAKVGTVEVNAAVVEILRTEQVPTQSKSRGLRIVTEGDTDVGYLVRAAELANREWGAHLLEECVVESAGTGRAGGGTAVVRKLAALSFAHDAIGLFDADAPGRAAKKHAASLSLNAICLPEALDPLRRGQDISMEIEDLLPVEMLDAFYEAHMDCHPEERSERGGLRRVVPKGEHKDLLMNYACKAADFAAFEKLGYVVCELWQGLGLPLPQGPASNMKVWVRTLRG